MARVFISSVMTGFGEERRVAREAVESLGHQPVMVEDFGAQSNSSRTACLEGVRSADWYLCILGERYGWIGPDGISPTEEEFREAERLGHPVVVIVKQCEMDDRQRDFIQALGGWESGYFYGRFQSASSLATAITRAIRNLESQGPSQILSLASARVRTLLQDERSRRNHDRRLAIAMAPAERRDWLDVATLGQAVFHKAMQQNLLFATDALFDPSVGTRVKEGREHISLLQGDAYGEAAREISIHLDGSLHFELDLREEDSEPGSFFGDLLIDEDRISAMLTGAMEFAAEFYTRHVSKPIPTRLLVQLCIHGASGKFFGRRPKEQPRSFSYPTTQIEDPLMVPKDPMLITLQKLKAPGEVVGEPMELIRRAFRAAGATWPEQQSRRR